MHKIMFLCKRLMLWICFISESARIQEIQSKMQNANCDIPKGGL